MHKINIAIDGHSSCGKSTMAKALAQRIGYVYIDTGAMYRGVTLYAMRHQLYHEGTPNESAISARMGEVSLRFKNVDGRNHLFLNDEDVENEIRTMEVSERVSPIAALPSVRAFLVEQQREMATEKGVVMDGRDVGTVVLPQAELKVFVTASPEIRARRRYDELRAKGDETTTYEEVLHNLTTRDHIDSSRAVGPLKQAEDALLLDNSEMDKEEQNELLYHMFLMRINGEG